MTFPQLRTMPVGLPGSPSSRSVTKYTNDVYRTQVLAKGNKVMATIVGAIGLPHNPNFPELVSARGHRIATPRNRTGRLLQIWTICVPTCVLIFTTDHLNTFFFENLPILALGVGDEFAGPNDEVPTVSHRIVPSHACICAAPAFARRPGRFRSGARSGIRGRSLGDRAVAFPDAVPAVPVIPIFISTHNPPRPSARRCFALGQTIRKIVEAWPQPLRVVSVGSGSFSFDVHGHLSPPGRPAGVPDPEWAERVRDHLERNADLRSHRRGHAGPVQPGRQRLRRIAELDCDDRHAGTQKLAWIKPEPQFGNSYAVWR